MVGCGIVLCCLGLATAGTDVQGSARVRPRSVEGERLRDERICRIVRGEMRNAGRLTSEFRGLLDGSRHSSDMRMWLRRRLHVRTKHNRMLYTCCLSSRGGVLERVKLPGVAVLAEDSGPGLALSQDETRYVEVLLIMLLSEVSRTSSGSEQLTLMAGSGEFPKIVGEGRFRSNIVRVLSRPAGDRTGSLTQHGGERWWNGRIPLLRARFADEGKPEGVDLLVALERSLGRWSEEVERRMAWRGGNRETSRVSLHLVRKELYRRGYYRLREVRCLESGLEVRSVLFYNAYWDHLTLLRPLGRWLQGRVTEAERGHFWDVPVEGQDVGMGNVGGFMSYGEGCVRLYDGGDWMVVLLVDNDGTSGFFASDRALLEETLAGVE